MIRQITSVINEFCIIEVIFSPLSFLSLSAQDLCFRLYPINVMCCKYMALLVTLNILLLVTPKYFNETKRIYTILAIMSGRDLRNMRSMH